MVTSFDSTSRSYLRAVPAVDEIVASAPVSVEAVEWLAPVTPITKSAVA